MGYLGVYGILLNRFLKKRVRFAFKWHITRAIIRILRTQQLIFDKRQGIARLNKRPFVSEGRLAFMQLTSTSKFFLDTHHTTDKSPASYSSGMLCLVD